MKKTSQFPVGWNEERVRKVLDHFEAQTEDEQHAEIEAAHEYDIDQGDSGDCSSRSVDS